MRERFVLKKSQRIEELTTHRRAYISILLNLPAIKVLESTFARNPAYINLFLMITLSLILVNNINIYI